MKVTILKTSADDFESRFATLEARGEPADAREIQGAVKAILEEIRSRGDRALVELTRRFDRWDAATKADLEVPRHTPRSALLTLDAPLRRSLEAAAARVRAFHELQRSHIADVSSEVDGVRAELVVRPLARVGIYVPGGTAAYPSTVLMNAIPARIAGVEEIVMTTPSRGGALPPVVLAAAEVAGVDRIFAVGGAQAVAALAFGTELVPRVEKIVGPGNAWVQEAKRQVFGRVAIDAIAGPSEVLILADPSADARLVAADLIAQAEHDVRASAIAITWDEDHAHAIALRIGELAEDLPRLSEVREAFARHGGVIVARDESEAIDLANRYAPEHLGLAVADPRRLLGRIRNAGAIFLGRSTTEAFGDYNAGTNHVLPTGGAARWASPLSVHDFVKRTSVLEVDPRGLSALGEDAARLARAEGLEAHARAVEARGAED